MNFTNMKTTSKFGLHWVLFLIITLLTPIMASAQEIVAKPVISPGSGVVVAGTNFTITCATPGASIYYTINGNTPVVGTTFTFLYAGPFGTNTNMTVKAIGVKEGMTKSSMAISIIEVTGLPPMAATPVISPGTGTFSSNQMVTISSSTPNATILYTVSGNVPVVGATFTKVYTGPFQVKETTTIRAIAMASGFSPSAVGVAYLTLPGQSKVSTPVISPGTGTVSGPLNATITCSTPGATVYYTTSGNEPVPGTSFTKIYTGPFLVSGNITIRAMAQKAGLIQSSTSVSFLTVMTPSIVATPVISLGTGSYFGPQTISIFCNTQGATIYYTTSGNTPVIGTSFTRLYTGPFSVSTNTTVRAMAVKTNLTNSSVAVSFLTIINNGGRVAVVEEKPESFSWNFFPNPTSGSFCFSGSQPLSEATDLLIFNSLGAEVKRFSLQPGLQKEMLNVTDLNSGVYFIRLDHPEFVQMERMIKN